MKRSIPMLAVALSVAGCDIGSDGGAAVVEPGPVIAERRGALEAVAFADAHALVLWLSAPEVGFSLAGDRVDAEGSARGFDRLLSIVDGPLKGWVLGVDGGAFDVLAVDDDHPNGFTVSGRRVAPDGAMGAVVEHPVETAPHDFAVIAGRSALVRSDGAGGLLLEHFDGAAWGPPTALASPEEPMRLAALGADPVLVSETGGTLAVTVFDIASGDARARATAPIRRELGGVHTGVAAAGLVMVWLDGDGRSWTVRRMNVGLDGADEPQDLFDFTGDPAHVSLTADAGHIGWIADEAGGAMVARMDAPSEPIAFLPLPGADGLRVGRIGGGLRAVTSVVVDERGELFGREARLWTLPE